MFRSSILLLLLGFQTLVLFGQSSFPVVPVYFGSGSYYNEPSICINPKNTNQVVAGSVLNDFYYSSNGGSTWTHGTLSCPWGVWGDPVVVVDTSGHFYYFHLAYPPSPGWWIDRIICQKSTNAGQTWSSGTYMGKNTYPHAQDKHWAVVDRQNNNIYVTWTEFDSYGSSNTLDSTFILFAKSTDNGATWTDPPKRINKVAGDCHDDDNTVEGAVPCVGPNGQIYVSWAGPLGIVFNRSLDQGNTWVNNNIFVSSMPGGWNYQISGIDRSNGLPVTCCDLSNGPYHGTIYINWTDQRNGVNDTDVWIVKSTDGGNTWTVPKRVNNDPAGKQQFFTWMAVDPVTGFIYIVFYDRRNYSDNQTDVYMAISTNGGETFENMRISSAPFTPNAGVFFGDYTNISAYNNIVRPIWTALSGYSTKTIYTALIDNPVPAPFSVSGTLKYFNADKTPMANVTLGLQPGGATSVTNAQGNFSFGSLAAGNYTISVTANNKAVGGINSTDAGAANAWFTTAPSMEYVSWYAGDVNNSLAITAADAQRIQQFFVLGTPFSKPSWTYWMKGDSTDGNIPSSNTFGQLSITNASLSNLEYYALCTGDFNGSFTPSSSKSTISGVSVEYPSSMPADPGQELELPLIAGNDMEIAAVSLILDYPSELVEIKGVSIPGSEEPISYAVNGNQLRIGWNSLTPLELSQGDPLLVLGLRMKKAFVKGKSVVFTLEESPLNELADENYIGIDAARLKLDIIDHSEGGEDLGNDGALELTNHPNPFSSSTKVSYSIPATGRVVLELRNLLGQTLETLLNQSQSAGNHTLMIDTDKFPKGVYSLVIIYTGTEGEERRMDRLVVKQ